MRVFCVIPAFNEAETIRKVINEVKPLVDKLVVVDDASTDQTCDLANDQDIILLKHIINRGQGASLRTGTEYSLARGADIIIHFDADGQFLSQDIFRIVEPIKLGRAEVVFGSRFLNNQHKRSVPFLKRNFIHPLAKFVNILFFKVNLTDPQSGFRAMTAAAAKKITWQQDRMAHCSEIMFMVKKNNFKVLEIPIRVIYDSFGQSLFGGVKILRDLFIALLIN